MPNRKTQPPLLTGFLGLTCIGRVRKMPNCITRCPPPKAKHPAARAVMAPVAPTPEQILKDDKSAGVYINRWEIECNHRDEKSLLSVHQGQVRNANSVRRLAQLQVAGYSLLLVASILSSGFQRTPEYLPLPEWGSKGIRPSLLDLLALLRDQIFATATGTTVVSFDDFVHIQREVAETTPGLRNFMHTRGLNR